MVAPIKVSDYVIKFLENKNIHHVFTVSGGGCIHLIDSLGKSNKIKYVCCHHEQACAMAVEGYSRMSEHIGCAIVTTGPGGINALNGVFGCWTDSIPAIFISGQVSLSQTIQDSGCRQIGDQEVPIVDIVKHITKYAVMIKNKNSIAYHLKKAYKIALSGRPGPVWIDIPLDIQGATVNEKDLYQHYGSIELAADISKLSDIKACLDESKKPLIVVGNGIRLSRSINILKEFLIKTNIPIATNCHSSVDIINDDYPYYMGRYGILGQRSTNQIIQECDLLLALGTRLPLKTTGYDINAFAKNAKKIVVDVDLNEINKHKFHIDYKVNCDLNYFLTQLLCIHCPYMSDITAWQSYCKELRSKDTFVQKKHYAMKDYVSIYVFIEKLSGLLPETIPTITSDGMAHVITQQTMKLKGNQRLFTNVGCASMGYGLPASMGACFANNYNPVVCIEGDGSIMMNLHELQTIKHHNLPIKIFIVNNGGYLSIKQTQKSFFGGTEIASGPNSGVDFPDYRKIANAFGIPYEYIENNDDIDVTLNNIIKYNNGPVICELFSHPKEGPEPKVMAKGIDASGRIIPGELTNMAITDDFE
jgi:acetolactate synthase-1/2/3 large subunit